MLNGISLEPISIFSYLCRINYYCYLRVRQNTISRQKKDNGEYLRVLSASGIITLIVTKLKPSVINL